VWAVWEADPIPEASFEKTTWLFEKRMVSCLSKCRKSPRVLRIRLAFSKTFARATGPTF